LKQSAHAEWRSQPLWERDAEVTALHAVKTILRIVAASCLLVAAGLAFGAGPHTGDVSGTTPPQYNYPSAIASLALTASGTLQNITPNWRTVPAGILSGGFSVVEVASGRTIITWQGGS